MKLTHTKLAGTESTEKGLIKTATIANDGIFETQASWLGESTRKVLSFPNDYKLQDLPEMTSSITLKALDTPVIPKEALIHVMAWYDKINTKNGEEAQINFYRAGGKSELKVGEEIKQLTEISTIKFWNDEIFSYVPEQTNSSAQTSTDDEIYTALNQQYGMFVETHSHNSMSAFKSGTDEANSHNDAVQLVFGKFGTDTVEMYSWITVRGLQYDGLNVEQLSNYVELPNGEYVSEEGTVSVVDSHSSVTEKPVGNMTGKRFYISKSELVNIDEEMLAEWDKQIIIPIRQSFTVTDFEGYYGGSSYKRTSYYSGSKWTPGNRTSTYLTHAEKIRQAGEKALLQFMEFYTPDEFELTLAQSLVKAYVSGFSACTYTTKTVEVLAAEIFSILDTEI